MANEIIRDTLCKEGIKYWELADALKIHPGTLSSKMRHELPEAETQYMLNLILKIKETKERN